MRSKNELDKIWKDINDGKFSGDIKPERISAEGADVMSIPNADGSDREVYERVHKDGEDWKPVPYVGRDK